MCSLPHQLAFLCPLDQNPISILALTFLPESPIFDASILGFPGKNTTNEHVP